MKRKGLQALCLVLLSVGLFFFFLLLVDRCIAKPIADRMDYQAIIFRPNTTSLHISNEFAVRTEINNLGIRGPQASLKRSTRYRILALGDSFTFGYGVEEAESWPRQLEGILRRDGLDVEVMNLGKSGEDPRFYAALAEYAIPLLKPDLILVGLLEGEDLAAMMGEDKDSPQFGRLAPSYIHGAPLNCGWRCPLINLLWIASSFRPCQGNLSEEKAWALKRERARMFLDSFTQEENDAFLLLPDEVREMLMNGSINPFLVNVAVKDPGRFCLCLDTETPMIEEVLVRVTNFMGRIKSVVAQYDGDLLVISIPHRVYATEKSRREVDYLGYTTLPEMVGNPIPEQLASEACAQADCPFLSVTQAFQRQAADEDLYYRYDLHFNPQGHACFARLIAPAIRERLLAQDAASAP